MPKLIDLTGQRFGKVVALRRADRAGTYWVCACDCGSEAELTGPGLRGGLTNSCGCLKRSVLGDAKRRHGQSNTRAQRIWSDAKRRCYSPQRRDYRHYGGRGIAMCDRWRNSFDAFLADMGQPQDGMTLDRIDPNGNYEPSNCRWATLLEQRRNCRSNLYVQWRGRLSTAGEIASETALPYESIRRHVRLGKTGDEAEAYVRAHLRQAATSAPSSL